VICYLIAHFTEFVTI